MATTTSIATKELVKYHVEDGVAIFELDDAPANTYSYEMMQQLDAAILKARMDERVHVLVLRGAGEKFFSAGASIPMLTKADPQFKYYFCLHANETLTRLEQTPKLVIAALNGHTVGGGLEIAMACGIRLARRSAGKVGLPEVALGVLPGTGGTQRLTRLLGSGRAMDLMVTGRTFDVDEAERLGLVSRVLDGDFRAAAHDFARQFCPPNKAAMAVGHIKRAVQSGGELPLESGLALERELQARLFASADCRAGLDAFLQKKAPVFTGR